MLLFRHMERFPHNIHHRFSELSSSSEVNKAVAREKKIHEGEEGYREPKAKDAKVDVYLDFLEDHYSSDTLYTTDDEGNVVAEETKNPLANAAFLRLKSRLLVEFSMNLADETTVMKLAQGLYESEKRQARSRGHGARLKQLEAMNLSGEKLVETYRETLQAKQNIQRKSLESWLDYLQQNDGGYPMWFRYLVVRSLEKMGSQDEESVDYAKRGKFTIDAFPELNSEALGWVYRQFLKANTGESFDFPSSYFVPDEETQKKKSRTLDAVRSKDFAKLYAFAELETAGRFNRESIVGEWRKYNKGSDHRILEHDLKDKGTGWCTATGSAHTHLAGGDFYVFFTNNDEGIPTEPRIAIRMENDSVAEVRGVDKRQALEPVLVETARAQYGALPGGEKYEKKASDMEQMTELMMKNEKCREFTKDDLTFLYELNAPIEGFGYDKDSRVVELRNIRKSRLDGDMSVIFECEPSQIAHSVKEIMKDTRAYVGVLEQGIFEKLPEGVEHVYMNFPEGRVRKEQIVSLEVGGKTKEELERMVKAEGDKIGETAEFMMQSENFKKSLLDEKTGKLKKPENIECVRITVAGLGFFSVPTMQEIFDKALSFGLELCPPEVGPRYRIQKRGQKNRERTSIAMKMMVSHDGRPHVFGVERVGDDSWLNGCWTDPSFGWSGELEIMFRLRKSNS